MEDADSDAEMADYGTDFSDDVDPKVTRESGIGNRIPVRRHRQGGFCHEAGFVLGQGTKPTLVIGP